MKTTDFLPELGSVVADNLQSIPDFPEPGVLFRDMAPLLANAEAFNQLVSGLAEYYIGKVDMVAGLESRGFLLAAPLAAVANIGMIMVRKAGKLPGKIIGVNYALEYGTARLELQPDTVPDGAKVLIIDDVLATGGTAAASVNLIRQAGGEVAEFAVLMELTDLGGRAKLPGVNVRSLLQL
ncbi:MAG: adenine phosphoribosyltransferase [Varibaculum sp.]|nr:adenine phosphoribosyltransferase [Varibaculum sp.]